MAGKSPCEAAFVHQRAGNRSVKSRLKVPLHGTVVATWSGRLFLSGGNGQTMGTRLGSGAASCRAVGCCKLGG